MAIAYSGHVIFARKLAARLPTGWPELHPGHHGSIDPADIDPAFGERATLPTHQYDPFRRGDVAPHGKYQGFKIAAERRNYFDRE